MNTFYLHTLGCKVNQYDSQVLRGQFLEAGFEELESPVSADVIVINTCTVTHSVEAKCRKAIRGARRSSPDATLVVTGCYANRDREKLANMPEVDHVFANEEKPEILKMLVSENPTASVLLEMGISGRERAFIKVQDGCENFCTYCIVPYVRGPVVSRPLEEILEEVQNLREKGYMEIVLTGIHLGQYSSEDVDFKELVKKTACVFAPGRVRLSSVDAYELPDETIEKLGEIENLCPHFHLPLQSGDDGVLKAMGRRYDSAEFLSRVEKLKKTFDRPGITTDIMVGFPGEGESAFRNTLEVVRKTGFSRVHIFTYSPRPGTPAADMTGQVDPREAARRYKLLEAAAKESAMEFTKQFQGKKLEVLVESRNRNGMLRGYSGRYLRLEFPARVEPGGLVMVEMTEPGEKLSRGIVDKSLESVKK